MKYKMLPVIDIYDLEKAVKERFPNIDFEEIEFRQKMFYDDYVNDCYKNFYFDDFFNDVHLDAIVTTLQETFPEYKECLINVAW